MERRFLVFVLILLSMLSCKRTENQKNPKSQKTAEEIEKSIADIKQELAEKGYQTFDFVDAETKDTILMQQYFIAFLKTGPDRAQSKEALDSLQNVHLIHLKRMYDEGYASISGPFGDDGAIRGITIYNVATRAEADSLANLDPMVKAGRLVIESHPWWAAKGLPLR